MIREAYPEDVERLIVLGWEMHGESSYYKTDFDVEKVAAFFFNAIESPDYLVIVALEKGVVVGGFVGMVYDSWFGQDKQSTDFALFIEKKYRGGMAAAKLIARYTQWALEHGVRPEQIKLGITTGVHTELTERLYNRLHYRRTGVLMAYKGE